MRSFIYCLFALVLSTGAFGQSLQNQQKIVDYLGQEKFDQIQSSNPSYLTFLDVKCSDGFDIIEMVPEKTQNFTVLNEIVVIDPNNKITKTPTTVSADDFVQMFENGSLNFLMYQLQGHKTQMTYYVLGNTGKVLMVFPTDYITQRVNQK